MERPPFDEELLTARREHSGKRQIVQWTVGNDQHPLRRVQLTDDRRQETAAQSGALLQDLVERVAVGAALVDHAAEPGDA